MRYSKEEKEKMLGIFHASGLSARSACMRYPGFPHHRTLSAWVRAEHGGELAPVGVAVRGRCGNHRKSQPYPTATKKEAVRLVRSGCTFNQAAKRLGVASAAAVRHWVANAAESGGVDACRNDDAARAKAFARIGKGERIADIAADLNVSAASVYRWARRAGVNLCARRDRVDDGSSRRMDDRTDDEGAPRGAWAEAWGDLPDDPQERARVAEVRLAEALAVLDVLKAPGPSFLTNAEKHRAGQMARGKTEKATLGDVLADFSIPKSTYLSQRGRSARADKYAPLRDRIRAVFEESGRRYGSESVWAALRRGRGTPVKPCELAAGDGETPVIVSEKVVRRIMREESLVPVQLRRGNGAYSSYKGEPDERPGNVPLAEDGTHDFHASSPGKLVVTDVTEVKLSDCKAYISPAIDCFDGMPIAWTVSKHPDDELTCSMLEQVVRAVGDVDEMVVHSDGGGNYRSRRWKGICEREGVTRSMSRKGRSPDNARAEGFFGTLKQEFFYARDWTGVPYGKFVSELNRYIVWYRDEKIKKSLGWKTIAEHRATLEAA